MPKSRYSINLWPQAISARNQPLGGCLRKIDEQKLSRIEYRGRSIESFRMNGFKLCGIDAPLIRCDLQPGEDGWQRVVDVPALVATDDATGPINQSQVFLEVE